MFSNVIRRACQASFLRCWIPAIAFPLWFADYFHATEWTTVAGGELLVRYGYAEALRFVVRCARYRPWQPCEIGVEICRDPLRDYTTVRWKADLASAAIERWEPRWFHYIRDPTGEDHPQLVLVSLLLALVLAQVRY